MIIFEKLEMQNFMSVGNSPLTLQLNKNQTTLVTATNGVGKSSVMLDSICFALYGRAYRNINKPQLCNSVNQKQCQVTVEFSSGKKKYKVVRGMKPNKFEIYENDKLINQDPNVRDYQKVLEQQILKMNYRAFTQVVVMGSAAYVPFMKLKPQERREFIEDLLDIRVFSVMNKLLFQKIKDSKEALRDTENDIQSAKEIIKVIESHVESKRQNLDTKMAELRTEIEDLKAESDAIIEKQKELKGVIRLKQDELDEFEKFRDRLDEISKLKTKIAKKLNDVVAEKDQYDSMTVCPTCNQDIHDSIKEKFVSASTSKIKEYTDCLDQLKEKIDALLEKLKAAEKIELALVDANTLLNEWNQKLYGNTLLSSKLIKELNSLQNVDFSEDDDSKKMKETARKIVALDKQRKRLQEDIQYQTVAQVLLQDNGIKAKVVKQYIPAINKLVNKYLNQLDFFVSFNLDENFNEVVKSRHRDAFSYDSFSQGEKQRIDLSLIFSWRAIAAMKNSVNTNLIILDELFDSSLDGSGFELCLALIAGMPNTNVFVVSHREAIADKFHSTIKLIKKNNFTVIDR